MKNKPLLLAMIMSILVATLFLTSADVKKVKLEDVYSKLGEVYDLVRVNRSKHDDTYAIVQNIQSKLDEGEQPIWKIFQDGTAQSVPWVDTANPRFAVYNGMVLDKETGLVWVKDDNISAGIKTWLDATKYLRNLSIGDRKELRQSIRCGGGKRS